LEDWTAIEEWFAAEGDVPVEENLEDYVQSIDNYDNCQVDEEYDNVLFSARLGQCDTFDVATQTSSSSLSTPQHSTSSTAQDPSSTLVSSEQDSRPICAPALINASSTWAGFKLVKDNIDKNICPSFQRNDRQTKSYHYCHAFALKDRIDLSSCLDTKPDSSIDPFCLLPTPDDLEQLKKNFIILVSRYMYW